MINIKELIVTSDLSVREALRLMNEGKAGILLLVNHEKVLVRTITDGDLRRLLINGRSFDDKIKLLPEKNPITAPVGTPDAELAALMRQYKINHIPLVSKYGIPESLVHLHDIESPILLSTPHMGVAELEYVNEAFNANWIAPVGPNVDAFEIELAEKVGVKYAAAVSSGTAAIHLALRCLGIKRGDIVFCSSLTFVASANPIVYLGAEPVFIDSDYETWNMSPLALEYALHDAAKNNRFPRAVIVVNLYGQSANFKVISELCERYDVPIVEDAAESLGASYQGKSSGAFGDVGIYSFNGNKIITTSGGGMLVSDNKDIVEHARYLSTQAKDPVPYYHHVEIGYNYRMSNVLAGIGRGQLKVLDERVKARRNVFERYVEQMTGVEGITWMPELTDGVSTRWLTTALIDPKITGVERDQLLDRLHNAKIEARHVWKPMHRQPIYEEASYYSHGADSVSDQLFENGICLPSSSHLTPDQQQRVTDCLRSIIVNN
jgi:dTDP-4-amino-4,6-dideoxygalactose transaminase